MYLNYYNLKRKPFEITTDPKFLWLGEKHKEALATLEYGIREDKGFLLMTGDIGTGKTVLIAGLAQKLDIQSSIATIPDPGLETLEFFNTLALAFKMGRKFDRKGDFLAHLRNFLLKAAADNRKVLLIIDEAQRLDHNLLEEIRLLSNIELHHRKLINIFFVGQPEFNITLLESRNKAVRQRIAIRYHIEPLTADEIGSYISHRLKIAGTKRKIFTEAAVREIFAFSDGNPRLTNIICDHALLSGYSTNLQVIDETVIKECRAELRLPDEGVQPISKALETGAPPEKSMKDAASNGEHDDIAKTRSPVATVAAFILFAIIAAIGGYFLLKPEPQESQTWSIKDMVPPPPKEDLSGRPGKSLKNDKAPDSAAELKKLPERPPESFGSREDTDSAVTVQEEKSLNLAEIQKIVIHFNHNSNELPTKTYRALDRFAVALIDNPKFKVDVRGYTDSAGSRSYNVSVSEFRANIIKSYLVGKGVNPSRIKATGLGPDNPIAPNETEEGRRQNRRVEIEFIAQNSGGGGDN